MQTHQDDNSSKLCGYSGELIRQLARPIGFFVLTMTGVTTHAQSVDCDKAFTAVEHQICDDKALGELDVTLADEVKRILSASPASRAALLADERRWISQRDRQCTAPPQSSSAALTSCLVAVYNTRIAEMRTTPPALADVRDLTAVCRKIADRYRPLAGARPGESPLTVLATTPGTHITTVQPLLNMENGTDDLKAWGAKRYPPVVMDDVIEEVNDFLHEPHAILEHIPNTNYYSISDSEGSSHCISAVYFTVTNGRAQTAPAPPGFAASGDECSCRVARKYGLINHLPAYFEEQYIWGPAMRSTLTVGTREKGSFVGPCHLTFYFLPIFTQKTLNNWGETCDRNDCDSLRRDAFKLAEAVQSNPRRARSDAWSLLTTAQQSEYMASEAIATQDSPTTDDPTNSVGPDPGGFIDESPFHLPYIHDRQVYVSSLGHFTIGWRYLSDWHVTFSQLDQGKLVERASFAVGMEKGKLKDVTISGPDQ
jgi:uncharacterized protein